MNSLMLSIGRIVGLHPRAAASFLVGGRVITALLLLVLAGGCEPHH